jgi:predicted DNA-binding antitoxin AbrB/MazE fold protein
MTTTVRAIYKKGVLKLRRLLPLQANSEVLVTVELPPAAVQDGASAVESMVTWPDITARLRALYGDKVLPANAVLAARADERF